MGVMNSERLVTFCSDFCKLEALVGDIRRNHGDVIDEVDRQHKQRKRGIVNTLADLPKVDGHHPRLKRDIVFSITLLYGEGGVHRERIEALMKRVGAESSLESISVMLTNDHRIELHPTKPWGFWRAKDRYR